MNENLKSVPGAPQSSALRPHEQTIARKMGDGMILLQLRTNRIFELNATAARLWELIVNGGDQNEIVETLAAEYDVDRSSLVEDLDNVVSSLLDAELITRHD